jgi:hypothetical protein
MTIREVTILCKHLVKMLFAKVKTKTKNKGASGILPYGAPQEASFFPATCHGLSGLS